MNGQMETTDCFTFLANTVGKRS